MKYTLSLLFLFSLGCSTMPAKPLQEKQLKITKKWVRNTLTEENLGFRTPHRMEPIVLADSVIQGNGIDGISSYNKKSGRKIWSLKLTDGIEGGAHHVGSQLFFGATDGYFYSVDSYTGKVLWKFATSAENLSSPNFYNGTIYFLTGTNRLVALNAIDGKNKWTYSRRDPSNISIRGGSKPAIDNNTVYAGFSDGFLMAFNAQSGKVLWEKKLNLNKRFKDVDSFPVVDGQQIYISGFDDALYALDKKTGKTLWKKSVGGFSAVTVDKNKIYYSTTESNVLAIDKNSGKTLWEYPLKKTIATQPKVYRGLVIFGEYQGELIALDANTGKKQGSFFTGRGIMGIPHIDKVSGNIYFISVNANLWALNIDWKKKTELWPWEK